MNEIDTSMLEIVINETCKNQFDCDGFDSLSFRHREHIRNTLVNKIDNLLNMDNYE